MCKRMASLLSILAPLCTQIPTQVSLLHNIDLRPFAVYEVPSRGRDTTTRHEVVGFLPAKSPVPQLQSSVVSALGVISSTLMRQPMRTTAKRMQASCCLPAYMHVTARAVSDLARFASPSDLTHPSYWLSQPDLTRSRRLFQCGYTIEPLLPRSKTGHMSAHASKRANNISACRPPLVVHLSHSLAHEVFSLVAASSVDVTYTSAVDTVLSQDPLASPL